MVYCSILVRGLAADFALKLALGSSAAMIRDSVDGVGFI